MARRIVDTLCDVVQNGFTARWNHKDQRTKMEGPLARVLGAPQRFQFAIGPRILVLWEYSHRREARIGNNARQNIMVDSEGLLWYIFPVDCLVGVILVELVFFFAKKPKMTAGRWCRLMTNGVLRRIIIILIIYNPRPIIYNRVIRIIYNPIESGPVTNRKWAHRPSVYNNWAKIIYNQDRIIYNLVLIIYNII